MTDRELSLRTDQLRLDVVQMIGAGKAGHLGGSCSLAEIVAVLYFEKMRHDPKNPKWEGRDRFLLSKGHAALIQYAALAECGYFPRRELLTLKKVGSRLQGHPDLRKLPGIEANTGSLGQGVALGCGIAAGMRLDGLDGKVYVAVGDGELAEGMLWESFMAAANFKLDHLRVILDRNHLQATGPTADRFDIPEIPAKLRAFGFEVLEIQGHNIGEIREALDRADTVQGKPVAIVAETVKGKGVSFAENVVSFHNGTMTEAQVAAAVEELKARGGVEIA